MKKFKNHKLTYLWNLSLWLRHWILKPMLKRHKCSKGLQDLGKLQRDMDFSWIEMSYLLIMSLLLMKKQYPILIPISGLKL